MLLRDRQDEALGVILDFFVASLLVRIRLVHDERRSVAVTTGTGTDAGCDCINGLSLGHDLGGQVWHWCFVYWFNGSGRHHRARHSVGLRRRRGT